MKITEYERGYQDAMGAAIAWLYAEAARMNDTSAKLLLNAAGSSLGVWHKSPALREEIKRRARG